MSQISENLSNIVQGSETVYEIKSEIKRQLEIADNILNSVNDNPDLKKKFLKEYEDLKVGIERSLESDNKVILEELENIKREMDDILIISGNNGIKSSIDIENKTLIAMEYSGKLSNSLHENVDFSKDMKEQDVLDYAKNPEQIFSIDNEEFLSRVLLKYKELNTNNIIKLKDINPKLRNNINILKILKNNEDGNGKNINFDGSELSLLNISFFKNIDNIIFYLERTLDYKAVFLILEQIYNSEELFIVINSILNSDTLLENRDALIKAIPLSILKLDKDNIIGKEGDFPIKDYMLGKYDLNKNGEELLKEFRENTQFLIDNKYYGDSNYQVKDENLNYTGEAKKIFAFINNYIELNGIGEIKEEIGLLIDNGYIDKIESLSIHLENNIDLAVRAIKYCVLDIEYIPLNLRTNKKIIKALIESGDFNDGKDWDYDNLFTFIEFENIKSLSYFLLLIAEKNGTKKIPSNLLSDNKIRYKIKTLIENEDTFTLALDYEITKEEEEILNNLSEELSNFSEEIKKIKNISEEVNKNEKYLEKLKKILKEEGINDPINNSIAGLLKSNKIITASIYNKILREFGNNEEKTKNLILKLNELIGKKISTDIKNTEIEVNEKIAEENEIYSSFILEKDGKRILDTEKIKTLFLDFLQNNPKKQGETLSDYKIRLSLEYFKKINLKIEEHEKINKLIGLVIDLEINKSNSRNIDNYIGYLSGKISKDEYENNIHNDINKDLSKNKDTQNNKVSDTYNYNLTESDFAPNGSGYSINTPSGNLIITKNEKIIIQNNPEALKNLINFHDFFKESHLLSIWEYRTDIVSCMDDFSINLDDDSLTEGELIKFGKNLIKFMNNIPGNKGEEKTKLLIPNNIGGIQNELKNYSQANGVLSNNKTFNIYGEDRFESDLRRLGIIGNSLGFKKETFRKIMKGEKI